MNYTIKNKIDTNYNEKIREAIRYEKLIGKPCYVTYSVPMECYLITPKMPLMGEWYSTDGLQHGG